MDRRVQFFLAQSQESFDMEFFRVDDFTFLLRKLRELRDIKLEYIGM